MRCRLITVVSLFALIGCSGSDLAPEPAAATGGKLRKVTLQLNWYPEAEHGGFYAAKVNGYYEAEGLDVEIVAGGADVPVTQRVATGQVDFGVENADQVLLMRAQEADIVAVMAPMQTSPRCLVVHESDKVTSFGDLAGFTIAMNQGEPFAQFLLQNALPADVEVVPYGGGVTHFLRGPKNAQQGYSFSEPFIAARSVTAISSIASCDSPSLLSRSSLMASESLALSRSSRSCRPSNERSFFHRKARNRHSTATPAVYIASA